MMRCGVWEKTVLFLQYLLSDTWKSVCVADRCSVRWFALAECVSGPLQGLRTDLRAQSEGSYLRQLRWPQEAGHYQAFSDPNYGGKVWNESGGPPRQPKPDPLSPITISSTRHTHTHQQQAYTTLSPWRAHAHTKSQHVSTLSFSLVIAIALTPAPPCPKRCTSIFSDSQRCTQLSNSLFQMQVWEDWICPVCFATHT